MSATTTDITVDTRDTERCNRQASVVFHGTEAFIGNTGVKMILGHVKTLGGQGAYDLYEVTFRGPLGVETNLFPSSFVASYFLAPHLLKQAETNARVFGSTVGSAREEYRNAQGDLVLLGQATWVRA